MYCLCHLLSSGVDDEDEDEDEEAAEAALLPGVGDAVRDILAMW
jgi:hypothetical protein